ncbi:MAG: ABC transporter substrate-binding protein [Chloroflexi bacterium]|nr:MAG: ABC transporter substrate-binding protein [Chloroflexota bacterium]
MKRYRANLIASVAVVLVLVACGGTTNSGQGSNLKQSIGTGEGALNLVAWTGYVESGKTDPKVDWVTPFTNQTGCKINVKFADTSDEMVTLMRQGGGTQWDGVSASGDATNRLIAHGDVAEVNTNLIPDFKDVIQSLQSPRHNTINGHHYGVPYMYGPNVLMYNTDVVKPAPTSWAPTWDANSPYKGKVAAYDSPIFVADAALYLKAHNKSLGITDVYELTSKQLDAAIALLKVQAPLIKKYWAATTDETDPFSSGDMVIGTAWPYQVSFLKSEKKPVAAVVPSEGATGWADTWMISSHAQHPNCMYQWMKWTASNAKACDILRKNIGDSADSDYHCGDNTFLKNIALWKTPLQECGDSRGATCTDYTIWQQKWQEVRGTK